MKKISISVILSIILIVGILLLAMNKNKEVSTATNTNIVSQQEESENDEMRGLWVSYITLDMSGTDRSFESFKKKFDRIILDAKEIGTNTLIVQVRPFSDALYKSEVYPASHILSGTQGEDVDFDALEYMCNACRENELKIHAWINPYRVASKEYPSELSKDNPYYTDEIGVETESGKYLNPSKKTVRDTITNGIIEIVENYSVDGIQFDDYFYPTDGGNFDLEDYNTYKKGIADDTQLLSLQKWRENNVNMLISQVYREIKKIKPEVEFGIAPQGNIQNDYELCADVKSWCESVGYVDYICPQMYYSIENPAKSFEASLKEWKEFKFHRNIKTYVGLGAYKAGTDADEGTWLNNTDELKNQIELLRKYGFEGYMVYDYNALNSDKAQGALSVMKEVI